VPVARVHPGRGIEAVAGAPRSAAVAVVADGLVVILEPLGAELGGGARSVFDLVSSCRTSTAGAAGTVLEARSGGVLSIAP
jgi:hypothetical protein